MNHSNKELLICEKTREEGLGSVYERIMLHRFFQRLERSLKPDTILEYHAYITKGYDNLAFADLKSVYVADVNVGSLKREWLFRNEPNFMSTDKINKRYDLVWNFAVLQHHPEVLAKMVEYAKKYILVFTPNILNYGTVPHVVFHKIVGTECQHPESGDKMLRTEYGLRKAFKGKNLKILKSGGIDIPWWPDTAYSFEEVKRELGWSDKRNQKKGANKPKKSSQEILSFINKSAFIENSCLPKLLKLPFIHHSYCLGEKK